MRQLLLLVVIALLSLQLQAAYASVEPDCCEACPEIGLCVNAPQCPGCMAPLLPSATPCLPLLAAAQRAARPTWTGVGIDRSLIWRPPQDDRVPCNAVSTHLE